MRERHFSLSPAPGAPLETAPPSDVAEPSAAPETSPSATLAPEPTPEPTQIQEPADTFAAVTPEPVAHTEQPAPPEETLGITCGWIAAGAALAAALIVSVLFLVFRRKRRAAVPAGPVGFALGKVHEQGARESQQDCFAVSPAELECEQGLLAVVADGMGGLSNGDKVSQTAVSAMLDAFCTACGEPGLVLLELLGRANQAVNRLLGAENLTKSGSTLAAGLIRSGKFHWISVGDSRIALYRNGALLQLNREHVYRNELFTSAVNGKDSFNAALSNPRAGGLTSYLGMGNLKYIDIPAAPVDIQPGDKFILMSDGVYNALGPDELGSALKRPAQDAAEAIRRAVEAKGYVTQDNYTAIIIEAASGERRAGHD